MAAGGPHCCGCNKRGRCVSCSCVKAGKQCINCIPLKEDHCDNLPLSPSSTDAPAATCFSLNSNLSSPVAITTTSIQPLSTSDTSYVNNSVIDSQLTTDTCTSTSDNPTTVSTTMSSSSSSYGSLPNFSPMQDPTFVWGNCDGNTVCSHLNTCYNEVIHWKRNLFKVPLGKIGDSFVSEMARLFSAYATSSSLESIALHAAMSMPHLLLQKPPGRSKPKDFKKHLERRLSIWMEGDFLSLLNEGRSIQSHLKSHSRSISSQNLARKFSNLVFRGDIKGAIRLLSNNENGRVLSLETLMNGRSVKDILKDKHPPSQPISPSAIYSGPSSQSDFHPVLFDSITSDLIRSTILRMSGSSGPSGLDASMWKHLSTSFNSSDDLCSALASLARKISTTYVDPSGLYPFLASRLIAIDKLPGVRPIGIGEVVRRIVGKAVLSILRDDILEATGTDQLCAGQPGGCEGAVHAVRNIFDSVECEAVLFVDASNAFNSLNRNLALINIKILCPSLSTILINCYRLEVPLSIDGEIMFSAEGTTQGDPLAMAMYAIGILPLIRLLNKYTVSQVWYADDAAALGQLKELHKWWVELVSAGLDFGYFVNPSKSWLLVKPSVLDRARLVFGDTSINLTTTGYKYLGSPIGSIEFVHDCICTTVNEWVIQLESLSSIAQTQPHAAYSVLTHGLLHKFTYLFRTTPNVSEFLAPLETIIRCKLIPTLTGQAGINDTTRSILSVPARLGGLAITNPITESVQQYNDSVFILEPLVDAIIDSSSSYAETISSIITDITSRKRQVKQSHKENLDTIISNVRDSIITLSRSS